MSGVLPIAARTSCRISMAQIVLLLSEGSDRHAAVQGSCANPQAGALRAHRGGRNCPGLQLNKVGNPHNLKKRPGKLPVMKQQNRDMFPSADLLALYQP